MSDKTQEAVDQVKEAAELAPIVDGVQKIADFTVKTEKRLEQRIGDTQKELGRQIEDVNGKLEKAAEDMLDRIDKMAKGRSVLGNLAIEDVTAPLKAVMTDENKQFAAICDSTAKAFPNDSQFRRPEALAVSADWFAKAARRQMGKFIGHHGELEDRLIKIERAFNDTGIAAGVITRANLTEGSDTQGGRLVPTIVEAEILRLIKDAGDIFPKARQIPMTALTHNLPNEATAVTVNWVLEEGGLTQGEPTFGVTALTASKIAGRATMSIEVVEDANVAILPYLQSIFAEAIAGELDFQCMEGTTPFTGVVGASGVNALATTTGTVGDPLTYPLLVSTFVAAGEKNTRAEGIWVMSPAVFGKVIGLVDSNGQPIVKFASVETAPNGTILGRPIVVSNRLSSYTVGSDATGNIYFGPPNKLIAGTRTGMRWDVTDQVNWTTYQMDARLIGRFAYAVGVPAAWTKLTKIDND